MRPNDRQQQTTTTTTLSLLKRLWRVTVLRHLIYWAAAFAAFFLIVLGVEPTALAFQVTCIVVAPSPLPIYLHAAAMRWLFERRRYWLYTLALLLIVAASEPFFQWFYVVILRDDTVQTSGGVVALFLITSTAGIKFYSQGLTQKYRLQEAESKQLQAELTLLRSQVHPHFLFNTLNNLYALTLERSDRASEGILMLSELMRYVLDGSGRKTVPLEEELKFTRDYVALEELRLSGQPDIRVHAEAGTDAVEIAPLLLIPFVENAFKHGAATPSGERFVHIDTRVENGRLRFTMQNSKSSTPHRDSARASGTGLANVKRRLELLYPGAHRLETRDQGERYCVELEIQL